jgi:hypothetical protein
MSRWTCAHGHYAELLRIDLVRFSKSCRVQFYAMSRPAHAHNCSRAHAHLLIKLTAVKVAPYSFRSVSRKFCPRVRLVVPHATRVVDVARVAGFCIYWFSISSCIARTRGRRYMSGKAPLMTDWWRIDVMHCEHRAKVGYLRLVPLLSINGFVNNTSTQ